MEDLFGKMQELMNDPESMKQISELAQMLQSETSAASAPPPAEETENGGISFDPMMLMKFSELLGSSRRSDENTALLMALRPHLRSERQEKVDKAVRLLQLMKLFSTLKESGMLQNLL